jgi:tetratricopeptide (TPR) repeat protein
MNIVSRPVAALPASLVLVALFGLGRPAIAADPAVERAKRHNATAKKLFSLGLFKEAAEEYELAYKARPDPSFLFNLAQCHKRITEEDHLEQAIFYFKSFLKNVPETQMRVDVEREILKLKRRVAELRRPAPFYKRWWFWTVVGVAVTGATVATAIALQPEDQSPQPGTLDPPVVPMP